MPDSRLSAAQVACLLVSTTCGTGFLLGTGELAVQSGMAACLYAVSCAAGLVTLTIFAGRLATERLSVWDSLEQRCGASVGRSAALLSIVWMTGVLASQIRGGSAILALTGLPSWSALILIDGFLLMASIMQVSWLAAGFACSILACNVALAWILHESGGFGLWLHAPEQFLNGIRAQSLQHTTLVFFAVTVMVLCGADYQQFVVAAKNSRAARIGCFVAAGAVLAVGFLPAAAVIASTGIWHLNYPVDPVQTIPMLLVRWASRYTSANALGIIVTMLGLATLGSGSSMLRAMESATTMIVTQPRVRITSRRIALIALGTVIAVRGQNLVEMMVDLNMIYISAVAPLLIYTLTGRSISGATARRTLSAGFGIAAIVYFLRWSGVAIIPEAAPLLFALPTALLVAMFTCDRPASCGRKTVAMRRLNRSRSNPDNDQDELPLLSRISRESSSPVNDGDD